MSKNTNFVFMSTGLFEHLSETEAYVFSFVSYFACDKQKGKLFKRSTISLCNNLGYSPNTIRSAINSLVEKKFLEHAEKPANTTNNLKYSYIEEVSHHLTIGTHEFAKEFSSELAELLYGLRGAKKLTKRPLKNVFFKVYVTALQASKKGEKWKRNQSRHLHKVLVLHGFLHNKSKWNDKYVKTSLALSVPYLSTMMQWSRSTVRRVINTLVELGFVSLKLDTKRVVFTRVKMAEKVRAGYTALRSTLGKVQYATFIPTQVTKVRNDGLKRPGASATPAEHSAFLAAMKNKHSC